MTRRQARRGNGRFTRNTPENTLGLHIDVCPGIDGAWCGRLLPVAVGERRRELCDEHDHCDAESDRQEARS